MYINYVWGKIEVKWYFLIFFLILFVFGYIRLISYFYWMLCWRLDWICEFLFDNGWVIIGSWKWMLMCCMIGLWFLWWMKVRLMLVVVLLIFLYIFWRSYRWNMGWIYLIVCILVIRMVMLCILLVGRSLFVGMLKGKLMIIFWFLIFWLNLRWFLM